MYQHLKKMKKSIVVRRSAFTFTGTINDCYMSVPAMISLPKRALINLGLKSAENVHYQLSPEELTLQTLARKEGVLNDTGALVIQTGEFTGRCPKDKFIVKDDLTSETIQRNEFNLPIEEKYF